MDHFQLQTGKVHQVPQIIKHATTLDSRLSTLEPLRNPSLLMIHAPDTYLHIYHLLLMLHILIMLPRPQNSTSLSLPHSFPGTRRETSAIQPVNCQLSNSEL